MPVAQILLVDDFLPWQQFLLTLFQPHADLQIVGLARDGFEAVQKARALQPSLVLMDVSLPGLNGFEAAREIQALCPVCKILFLSEHRSSDIVGAAFDAGACGYVLKSDSISDLIRGVCAVLAGQQFVSTSLANWRDAHDSVD